jgi:hypothetical protein
VIVVARLRDALAQKATTIVDDHGQRPIAQTGSAAFAIAVLNPPWRQRFEGTEDLAGEPPPPVDLNVLQVSMRARAATLKLAVENAYQP